jgi:hypothetical protein
LETRRTLQEEDPLMEGMSLNLDNQMDMAIAPQEDEEESKIKPYEPRSRKD